MRDFQDTFETCKRSFVIAFSFCGTVPLREIRNSFKKRPLFWTFDTVQAKPLWKSQML